MTPTVKFLRGLNPKDLEVTYSPKDTKTRFAERNYTALYFRKVVFELAKQPNILAVYFLRRHFNLKVYTPKEVMQYENSGKFEEQRTDNRSGRVV